ncbi:MAG TPA: bifunctional UDP-N-acetylglucosamine diphosphorylase/glucosamine-1-phosphate N-acetyltransferase GlmU [Bacillota bacterium]
MPEVQCVILAAGQGTRMKSNLPKVIHQLAGRPMIEYVVEAAAAAVGAKPLVVVGYQRELIEAALGDRADYVIQEEQLGTGHAVAQTASRLRGFDGTLMVLPGDTPLLTRETLADFIAAHQRSGAGVTLLTARVEDPAGYGRVIRSPEERLLAVVEDRDATPEERQINEINTAIYCFDSRALFAALPRLKDDNAQKEYYLPDVVRLIMADGRPGHVYAAADPDEVSGINHRRQLAEAEAVVRRRILDRLMTSGVTVTDPDKTYVDADVVVGRDATILPFTFISGRTEIGEGCVIGPSADIRDSRIGPGCVIQHSVIEKSQVGEKVTVGPYSHLRAGNVIGSEARIGNYAELKNSVVGRGTKISHHSYIGDTEIGGGVNIGAGVVVVNYDGEKKHRTVIGPEAFIGCNNNLVAPITIGRGAYTAAGSTLTNDVPGDALAIARSKEQVNIEGWAKKRRERAGKPGPHSEP